MCLRVIDLPLAPLISVMRAWDITLVTAKAAQRMVDVYCMFAVVGWELG